MGSTVEALDYGPFRGRSSMVEPQPSKLMMPVRSWSAALAVAAARGALLDQNWVLVYPRLSCGQSRRSNTEKSRDKQGVLAGGSQEISSECGMNHLFLESEPREGE